MADRTTALRTLLAILAAAITINLLIVASAHGAEFSRDTTRLPWRLQMALAKANAYCGISIDNTWRKGARKPNGRVSLHALWRAADITSKNYPCVMRALADWPGCLSTDWRRMRHVHIDDSHYGARCRFAHVGQRATSFATRGTRDERHTAR